jgi:hypothetical protein
MRVVSDLRGTNYSCSEGEGQHQHQSFSHGHLRRVQSNVSRLDAGEGD